VIGRIGALCRLPCAIQAKGASIENCIGVSLKVLGQGHRSRMPSYILKNWEIDSRSLASKANISISETISEASLLFLAQIIA
jgi:hypothetical protein